MLQLCVRGVFSNQTATNLAGVHDPIRIKAPFESPPSHRQSLARALWTDMAVCPARSHARRYRCHPWKWPDHSTSSQILRPRASRRGCPCRSTGSNGNSHRPHARQSARSTPRPCFACAPTHRPTENRDTNIRRNPDSTGAQLQSGPIGIVARLPQLVAFLG